MSLPWKAKEEASGKIKKESHVPYSSYIEITATVERMHDLITEFNQEAAKANQMGVYAQVRDINFCKGDTLPVVLIMEAVLRLDH